MPNQLEQLRQHTTVVADTGDFASMRAYEPRDATTNPSLILKAAAMPEYSHIVDRAIADAGQGASIAGIVDRLLVAFGVEILGIIPGRVSSEVDARLSFDTGKTVERARELIDLYTRAGIDRARVLIKIAATWEGIRAAEILERGGIHCNLTLLFSFAQAVECAQARVQLISPFVGRILDWHKRQSGRDFAAHEDPGVLSVRRIYHHYKRHGYRTEVMGASFRNREQILELAGCDLLTIAPSLLGELQSAEGPVPRRLAAEVMPSDDDGVVQYDEAGFRYAMNEDAMATEKTAEGIRLFAADIVKLEALIARRSER
jgi:transaldolase